jgi:prolyl 4-hydroxylase
MSGSIVLKILGILVPAVAIFLGLAQINQWPFGWQSSESGNNLEVSDPKTYILTSDPVVVYVKDFISAEEAAHLVAIA